MSTSQCFDGVLLSFTTQSWSSETVSTIAFLRLQSEKSLADKTGSIGNACRRSILSADSCGVIVGHNSAMTRTSTMWSRIRGQDVGSTTGMGSAQLWRLLSTDPPFPDSPRGLQIGEKFVRWYFAIPLSISILFFLSFFSFFFSSKTSPLISNFLWLQSINRAARQSFIKSSWAH